MNFRSAALPWALRAGGDGTRGLCARAVIAARLGAGQTADAFFLFWFVVHTCHDLLFVGTLGACVGPLLARGSARHEPQKSDANFVLTLSVRVAVQCPVRRGSCNLEPQASIRAHSCSGAMPARLSPLPY